MTLHIKIVGAAPERKSVGAAGYDLCASKDHTIPVGQIGIVGTGLRIAVPLGYELQVRARSGMAARGILVANAPGTVDSDYRGEIGVILINMSGKISEIKAGDRVAQAVFARVEDCVFENVETLDETSRGSGGFGSTGS